MDHVEAFYSLQVGRGIQMRGCICRLVVSVVHVTCAQHTHIQMIQYAHTHTRHTFIQKTHSAKLFPNPNKSNLTDSKERHYQTLYTYA